MNPLLSLTTVLALAPSLFAQSVSLTTPITGAPQSAKAWDRREKLSNSAIKRSTFVRMNTTELRRQVRHGFRPLGFRPFGKDLSLTLDRYKLVHDYIVLTGRAQGREGDVILVIAPDDVCYGTVHLVEDSYALVYTGTPGIHALQELESSKSPCCGGAIPVNPVDVEGKTPPTLPAGPNTTYLDVAVYYTPRAMNTGGGKSGIEATILGGIEQANATNRNSKLDVEFRLVHVKLVNYTENGSGSDLGRFRGTRDGYMDSVHAERNAVGADLMHLITQPTRLQYCGVAYLQTRLSSSFQSNAFGVTVRSCIGGNVMAHEMGHNLGCHHDRNNAGGAIYPHAYGFRTKDNKYRTVMAYSPGSRVNVWSSPNVKHLNYTMGVTGREDNVLTIQKTKNVAAAYRSSKALTWCELTGEIKGFLNGPPKMRGQGSRNATVPPKITITGQRYLTRGMMVLGAAPVNVPFFGGTLVPAPHAFMNIPGVFHNIEIDAKGLLKLPPKSQLWIQAFFIDPQAVQGVSATNGFKIIMP